MKKLLVALLVVLAMTSCNSFKVNVNLENSTDKTISLQRYDCDELKTIETVVAKDNMAVFKVKKSKNTDALHIMIDGWRRPLAFFADNKDVTITGDCQKYNGIKVEASDSQLKVNGIMEEAAKTDDDDILFGIVKDYVQANTGNPTGPYMLYRYKWLFSQQDLRDLLNSVPKNMMSGYRDLTVQYLKGLELTNEGNPYIDFTQKDVNGNDFSMSAYVNQKKAKVIVLDFWASWCPDCRKENPGLVAVYNRFKDKGLDIISVSLDTDEEAWKKAIANDKLTWENHVSDLKGWKNAVAEQYTIAFIPQNLILDENGIILEKNLPIEKMDDLFGSILK